MSHSRGKKFFLIKNSHFEFIDWFSEFAFSLKDRTCARRTESKRGTHFSFAFCSFIYVYIFPARIFLHIAIFPAFLHIDVVESCKTISRKSVEATLQMAIKLSFGFFPCVVFFRKKKVSARDSFFCFKSKKKKIHTNLSFDLIKEIKFAQFSRMMIEKLRNFARKIEFNGLRWCMRQFHKFMCT